MNKYGNILLVLIGFTFGVLGLNALSRTYINGVEQVGASTHTHAAAGGGSETSDFAAVLARGAVFREETEITASAGANVQINVPGVDFDIIPGEMELGATGQRITNLNIFADSLLIYTNADVHSTGFGMRGLSNVSVLVGSGTITAKTVIAGSFVGPLTGTAIETSGVDAVLSRGSIAYRSMTFTNGLGLNMWDEDGPGAITILPEGDHITVAGQTGLTQGNVHITGYLKLDSLTNANIYGNSQTGLVIRGMSNIAALVDDGIITAKVVHAGTIVGAGDVYTDNNNTFDSQYTNLFNGGVIEIVSTNTQGSNMYHRMGRNAVNEYDADFGLPIMETEIWAEQSASAPGNDQALIWQIDTLGDYGFVDRAALMCMSARENGNYNLNFAIGNKILSPRPTAGAANKMFSPRGAGTKVGDITGIGMDWLFEVDGGKTAWIRWWGADDAAEGAEGNMYGLIRGYWSSASSLGNVLVNEGNNDVDFIVYGDNSNNLFRVDAANDQVIIGKASADGSDIFEVHGDATFIDDVTADNFNFTDGHSLSAVYGFMWLRGEVDRGVGSSFASFTNMNAGVTNNVIIDTNAATMQVLADGIYDVEFSCSFSGDPSDVHSFHLYVDGAIENSLGLTRKLGTGGDVGDCGFDGLISLTNGQNLAIYAYGDNGNNIAVSNLQWSVKKEF